MKVEINNNPIVSVFELNQVLELKHPNNEVEIVFLNPIKRIDIVFIAGLILHHKKNKSSYIISSPQKIEKSDEVEQYLIVFERLFKEEWNKIIKSFFGANAIPNKQFIMSSSFAPIILINNKNIDRIFKQAINTLPKDALRMLCKKYIARIKDLKSGTNKWETEYLESDDCLIHDLMNYSPIHIFVFVILYVKERPFVNLRLTESELNELKRTSEYKLDKKILTKLKNKAKVKKGKIKTLELWEFTKEYVRGLNELAKNIIEHSSTKEGMITIRAYDNEEQIDDLKDKILETHVFDFGDIGIIQTLIENTAKSFEKLTDKDRLFNLYNEDIETLKSNYKLKDFVEPTHKILNQQKLRELAHYGLLKFYNLIRENKGEVNSSSINNSEEREYYPNNNLGKSLFIGTSYYFQLPFYRAHYKSQGVPHDGKGMSGTSGTVSGLSDLMSFEVVEADEKNTFSVNGKNEKQFKLLDFNSLNMDVKNRDDEKKLFQYFKAYKNSEFKDNRFLAVNMDLIKLESSSSLLRFLAFLSGEISFLDSEKKSSQLIIIYNLEFELYDEMIDENTTYFRTLKDLEKTPFWYRNKGILIFTRLKDNSFNLGNLLYGSDKSEFENINKILRHSFPNYFRNKEKPKSNEENIEIPTCLKPYFYESSLLPFDLLLKNKNEKTIFQSNLKTLLNIEIESTNRGIENVENYIKSLGGYKISNTHFKIGAKIHAHDFYYAKRLFQNSYYTSRIAMLLAIKIRDDISDLNQSMTLIGYEMYSELLISLMKKFLKEYGYEKINHFVTNDIDGEIKYFPKDIPFNNKIIIVVPIIPE